MALRMPILEIPLDDKAFQKFAQVFGDYSKTLEKTPAFWKQTNAAILSQGEALRRLGTAARPAENLWRNIAGWSGAALSSTMRITGELLKWGTIIGGGLLGGSLFGITRMASDVSNYRRSAMGLGMSIGGMRSFGINMGRFVDPGSFLASINQAVSNPTLQGPLYALGVNPNGSTDQVSLSMLKAMRRLALATPRGELGLMSQAYGLGPYGGLETLMRLKTTSAREFYAQLTAEQRDKSALGLPPGVARKWQDFTTQMDRARASIFKTFVLGLAPLAGPLTKLSGAFTGFVERLMDGPLLKGGIDKLATWLNKFSVEIASQKFQSAVASLVSDTGIIAQAFHALASDIRGFEQHPVKSVAKAAYGAVIKAPFKGGEAIGHWLISGPPSTIGFRQNNPGNLMFAGQPGAWMGAHGLAAFHNANQGLAALAAQLRIDAARGDNTLASLITSYAPPGGNDTAAYIRDVVSRTGLSANARLNFNNPHELASVMRAMIRHENGYSPNYLGAVGRAARLSIRDDTGGNVGIIVRNKTGSNAVLAGAGLAGVPQ